MEYGYNQDDDQFRAVFSRPLRLPGGLSLVKRFHMVAKLSRPQHLQLPRVSTQGHFHLTGKGNPGQVPFTQIRHRLVVEVWGMLQ